MYPIIALKIKTAGRYELMLISNKYSIVTTPATTAVDKGELNQSKFIMFNMLSLSVSVYTYVYIIIL